jgi:hypothetical protein
MPTGSGETVQSPLPWPSGLPVAPGRCAAPHPCIDWCCELVLSSWRCMALHWAVREPGLRESGRCHAVNLEQADRIQSANAALSVRGGPPPPTPPRRVPACGDSPRGQGWRYTPGPRTSSCVGAAGKPCSLRGLGLWQARARCTASLYRLALRARFAIMAFMVVQWAVREPALRNHGIAMH